MTTSELKRLITFLDSSYFAQIRYRKECIQVVKIVEKARSGDGALPSREQLSVKLFAKKEEADSNRLDKVLTELHKMTMRFLLVDRYLSFENETTANLDWGSVLIERGLLDKTELLLQKVGQTLKKQEVKSFDDYQNDFKYSYLVYRLSSLNNSWRKDLYIPEVLQSLDRFYWVNKLVLINHLIAIKKIGKFDLNKLVYWVDIDKILSEVEGLYNDAAIMVLGEILKLFSVDKPTAGGFEYLLNLANKYEDKIDKNIYKICFVFIRNYCTLLVNRGNYHLRLISFKIYESNLKKGLLNYQDMLLGSTFINVINVACRVNELDWADKFIEENKNRIFKSPYSEDAQNLGIGTYFFFTKKYQEAIDILPHNTKQIEMLVVTKRFEIMAYYELESELFYNRLDAFKMYVSRASDKILSEDLRESNINFINFLYQICHHKPGAKEKGKKILEKIIQKEQTAEKEWLLEKARALK